jgi:hypothetical protein
VVISPPTASIFKLLFAVAALLTPLKEIGNKPTTSFINPSSSVSKPIFISLPFIVPEAVIEFIRVPVGI